MVVQNADWPRFFSYSPDIFKYLDKVCETFGLRKYMTFNTKVTGCYWNEERGEWKVTLREEKPGQEPRDFEDYCHLLLQGTGILNDFKVRRWLVVVLWIGKTNAKNSGQRSQA